jgi:multiple antibiotic resistance protein
MTFFLLAFPALFSIINPIGGAFVFLTATKRFSPQVRAQLARYVATYSFVIVMVACLIGAYVLNFFGISVPVLRVGGGIVIALSAWQLLNAEDPPPPGDVKAPHDAAAAIAEQASARRMAFYPLTMPLTTGPGTIAVAVSLGTSRTPEGSDLGLLGFVAQLLLATTLVCAIIYLLYRYASRLSRLIGGNGTAIVMRLSAFLLFCIGIQVFWTGASELLRSV